MNKKDIIANAASRLSIETLNPMQLAVLSDDARRIILLAPTGSGKTLAFTIAMLKNLQPAGSGMQALVIAPSRELVMQTGEVIRRMATGYKTSVFYGGHPLAAEIDSIKGGMPDIVVSTPGRLLDHLDRHSLSLDRVFSLVLDEYDKSLELGFLDQMKRIAKKLPRKISLTMLTSATELRERPDFIKFDDATVIDYTERTESPRSRMQVVEVVSPIRDKLDTLSDLLLTLPEGDKSIVFVNHRESAERVYKELKRRRFPVGLYHGGLEQRDRELAVDMFDNASTPILVATDLAARGLDIEAVGNVIHYHHATSPEAWTHRNGRTARVDSDGTVYVITSEGEDRPEFEVFDRELHPSPTRTEPVPAQWATLFFNAGKREKISRGDIAGFLMQQAGLGRDEVGRIVIKDHSAVAAVPRAMVSKVLSEVKGKKLKNKSVKVDLLKTAYS